MTDTLLTFTRGMDTYVDSLDATTDHSQLPFIPMLASQTVWLLRLGVGDVPLDVSAGGAWPLTATVHAAFDGTPTLAVRMITTPWLPGLGYADLPTLAGTAITFTGALAAGATVTWNLAPFAATIAAGGDFYGWAIYRTDAGTQGSLCGLRADPDGPTLLGDWTTLPEPPTGLVPAAGQVVGEPRPTVRFDGQAGMLAETVQIHTTTTGWVAATGWSSPFITSGNLTTTDPEFKATADLAPATNYYWTARVENESGWGDYCNPVGPFTYAAKAAVTITSPAFGVTSDCDPLYGWTVAGTQTRYQVLTYPTGNPAAPMDDSGDVPSSVAAYQTVGKIRKGSDLGVVLPDGRAVTGEVRVWDNVANRVATPGCPVYAVATEDYQFASNATVVAPESVSVTQVGSSPWVKFQVLLATAPEYIIFMWGSTSDNTVHIARKKPANLPPPEDIEGSLLYTWIYWAAQPWQPGYVGGAKAVVGGQSSNAEFGALASLEVSGFWVGDADPASNTFGVYTQCSGVGTTLTRQDQIGILNAYGAQFPMVQYVVSGALGVNIQGAIRDFDGVTASEWQRAWRRLAASGRVMQIAYDDTSFPGVVYNYSVTELDGEGDPFVKAIQVAAIQTDFASYADEPGQFGDGPTLLVYDFEEGVDGAPIVKESLGGSPGVIDKDGAPLYEADDAIHGVMGADLGWRA